MIRDDGRLLTDPGSLTAAEFVALLPLSVVVSGALPLSTYTTAMEYSGANPIYIGLTAPGAAVTDETWQIKKLTYSGDNVTNIQLAEGSTAFDKAWNSRAGFSYS